MRLELEPGTGPVPLVQDALHAAGADSSEARDTLNEGVKAAQAGDRRRARTMLLRAVELDPRSESGWLWLASISEFPEELLAFLENVLEINPENARALEWHAATRALMAKTFVQRGIDAVAENRRDFASECFNQALEYNQQNAMAWMWLASISSSNEGKIAYLERVLSIEPENAEALSALKEAKAAANEKLLADAKAAAVSGRRDDALEIVHEVLSQTCDCTEAWILRSHLVESFDEKIVCYDSILTYDPENTAAAAGREMLVAIMRPSVQKAQDAGVHKSADARSVAEEITEPDSASMGFENGPSGKEFNEHPTHGAGLEEEREFTQFTETAQVDSQPVNIEEGTHGDGSFDSAAEAVHDDSDSGFADAWSAEPDVTVPDFAFVESGRAGAERPADARGLERGPEEPSHQHLEATIAHEKIDLPSAPVTSPCVFCSSENQPQAIACGSCRAVLTLSDLEMLLANQSADKNVLREAVERMEIERTERDFNERDLTILGLGHLNLRNFESGYSCLFDASQLNPNNVVLERQVNSLLIRLEEIKQRDEVHEQMTIGKTILVVDDSPTVRKLIAGKLEKCGHEVYCCNDGVEAMDYLQSLNPDLVLLDIAMPRMDGYQVCKLIRGNSATKEVPVVMISGKDGFFDKARGRMAGANGYITKPFGPETLMRAVEHYLNGQKQEFE